MLTPTPIKMSDRAQRIIRSVQVCRKKRFITDAQANEVMKVFELQGDAGCQKAELMMVDLLLDTLEQMVVGPRPESDKSSGGTV